MYFSVNGHARKNGFRFELQYGQYLDGVAMENPWFLFVSQDATKTHPVEKTYTERSHRFQSRLDAALFCDDIAAGKITISQLKEDESRAWQAHDEQVMKEARKEFDSFLSDLEGLGVDITTLPEAIKKFNDLSDKAREMFFDKAHTGELAAQKESQSKGPSLQTFGDWLEKYQNDIDVCLLDRDTGEHYMDAVCYLHPDEIQSGDYEYSALEKWLLSLPLDHVQDNQGCLMAVVNTDFNWNQTIFLLEESGFEDAAWSNRSLRAIYAGADFSARLAYLTDQKPFERPFDGTCMDVADPAQHMDLCELLADHTEVYIASFPDDESEFYAYTIEEDRSSGKLIYGYEEIPIKHTEPGKGLTSTFDGKVFWAEHVGKKAKAEALAKAPPAKDVRKEL